MTHVVWHPSPSLVEHANVTRFMRAHDFTDVGAFIQRETLFPGADALGQVVFVGRIPIEVIGVLESKGVTVDGLSEEDNLLVVPVQTGLRRIFNLDYLASIYVELAEGAHRDRASAEIASVLRDRHDLAWLDDFTIRDQALLARAEAQTVTSFRRSLNALGATALALGGVGILAVMLLAVKERTGEIGLRLAVGARRRDVLLQFLAEGTCSRSQEASRGCCWAGASLGPSPKRHGGRPPSPVPRWPWRWARRYCWAWDSRRSQRRGPRGSTPSTRSARNSAARPGERGGLVGQAKNQTPK